MPVSPGPLRRLRDRGRAHSDGKRDRLLGIPTHDETVHPRALLQIAQWADEVLAELARSWIGSDARLRERVGTTTRELRSSEEDVRTASAELAVEEQRRQAVERDAPQPARGRSVAVPVRSGARAIFLSR